MNATKKAELQAIISHISGAVTEGSVTTAQVASIGTLLLYLLSEVEGEIPSVSGLVSNSALSTALASYYTKLQIESKGYINSANLAQNIANCGVLTPYAKSTDIPSLDDYAKLTDIPSLAAYAKLTDIPSLEEYAKLTDIPSLAQYAKKSEIPDTTNLATKAQVTSIGNQITSINSAVVNLGVKVSTGNANDMTLTSRYLLTSGTNVPSTPCYLEVLAASTSFIVQNATLSDGTKKTRVFNGSTWSTWA